MNGAGGWGQHIMVSFCYCLLLSLSLQFSSLLVCSTLVWFLPGAAIPWECPHSGVSYPQLPVSPRPGIGHPWPQCFEGLLASAWVRSPTAAVPQSREALREYPPAQSISSQECISSSISNNAPFHKSSHVPPSSNDYHPFLHAWSM